MGLVVYLSQSPSTIHRQASDEESLYKAALEGITTENLATKEVTDEELCSKGKGLQHPNAIHYSAWNKMNTMNHSHTRLMSNDSVEEIMENSNIQVIC